MKVTNDKILIVYKKTKEALEKEYGSEIYNEILKKTIFNKEPVKKHYYFRLCFPYLFYDFFNYKDSKIIDGLSMALFLYNRSLEICNDKTEFETEKNLVLISEICKEKTTKILLELFSENKKFIEIWNKRRVDYFNSMEIENLLINETYSLEKFENFINKKSASHKISIDSMFLLADNKKYKQIYENLLTKHTLYSVGLQIINYIDNFSYYLKYNKFNSFLHVG